MNSLLFSTRVGWKFLVAGRATSRLLSYSGPIKKIGMVGLGLMGHGIAQMSAQAGFQVVAVESSPEALAIGMKRIEGSLSKLLAKDLKKGLYANEQDVKEKFDSVMANIQPTINVADAKDCDMIVEAIIENEKIKCAFYKDLGPIINPEAIFASNTSSLAITSMALASGRPEKFVGLHFFNPVQLMKLVEVVKTEHTDQAVFDIVSDFGKSIGKTTVTCKDTPGFIVNRLLIPYLTQAMAMVDRGDASVTDIDISMQLGAGHPMGPLHLADYVGLDISYNVLKGWQESYPNDPAFFVPACLEEMVKKGQLGRKSGQGFYHWNGDKVTGPVER
jgi:3-hydroxyacyl-CoA dehydrogenase